MYTRNYIIWQQLTPLKTCAKFMGRVYNQNFFWFNKNQKLISLCVCYDNHVTISNINIYN